MASAQFVFYLTCLFLWETAQTSHLTLSSLVRQDRGFLSANTGDSVTLRCFYQGNLTAKFYWYKQSLGEKLRLISMFYKYETEASFYDEFKGNQRFTLDTEKGKNHLKITDLRTSDSATYYCASSYTFRFEFAEGTILNVKGSGLNIQALVQQSASKNIQPGHSVTLNCTIHTGTCDGEHHVYWLKTEEESHPRIIYTHGSRNGQCERGPNTQTQTCVYNLPLKSLNLTNAGTYYCAVTSCGHITFGNGTKLNFEQSLVLVYLLSGALAFTTILTLLFGSLLYMMKRNTYQTTGSHARVSASSIVTAETYKTEENLHYAAVRVKKTSRSRRLREEAEDKCLYSSVKA